MKQVSTIAIGLLCAVTLVMTGSTSAQAGTFTMKQCAGSGQVDFQGVYSTINGSTLVDSVNACNTNGPGKIGVYQDRSGPSLSFGAGGQFVWMLPEGTRVVETGFASRLNDVNGIVAQLVGFNNSVSTNLDEGVTHDGNERFSNWSNQSNALDTVVARITCRQTYCGNAPGGPKAFMEVTDVVFTVRDSSPPTVAASGELWNWVNGSDYHRGSTSVRVDATDQGSGIAAAWIEVNGLRVDLPAPACPGDKGSYSTRFTPCPLSFAANKSLNTAVPPFQEGTNLVRFCARDYASHEAAASRECTPTKILLVDNQSPGPALNLRADEGSGWQPENGFTLRWEIPSGQKSPIIGAGYLVHNESGQLVGSGYFPGTGKTSGGPIDVPEVGAFEISISLLDGAYNLGEPARTIVRFDDRPPGDVEPEPASGWISRDELPISQEIGEAEPGGPSGISGYALSTSPDGPARPCESAVCLAPELTLTGGPELRTGSIAGLTEGSHWISAVAVSGARRASLEPGSTMVQVDRTVPTSTISGIPNEWVNHPVSLTVHASDRLSGMKDLPGDDGQPKTVIAAENYAPYASPGPVATFAVATEGVNRIRYWAEDLAGNANDGQPGSNGDIHPTPGQAVVRIDTTAPNVVFDPVRNPEDPELVKAIAEDADSGVASVSIGIRRAGSGDGYMTLPTTGEDGHYEARIPSDDLTRGAYELTARAKDRAGNEKAGNLTSSGNPLILNLPLKQGANLSAFLGEGKTTLRTSYGKPAFVEGRLTVAGSALPNQTIQVTETFVAGSRSKVVTRSLTTDGDGRYRLRLKTGPSRSVATSFEGTRKVARTAAPDLKLEVKGKVKFRFKPRKIYNGGVVRMKGSVGFRGVLPPARGKLVAIQYFDPGRNKWRPVEVLRTNRKGRFRYSYRFRTISTAQRIIFRANALPEAGWPYLPSTSKPRSVIVYPKG